MQPVPQPDGNALKRRRGQSLDLVEQAVVERVPRVFERGFKVFEVQDEARLRVGLTVDGDAHAEGMAVHARVRMPRRRRRQEMRGLEMELFIDAHGGRLADFAGV